MYFLCVFCDSFERFVAKIYISSAVIFIGDVWFVIGDGEWTAGEDGAVLRKYV